MTTLRLLLFAVFGVATASAQRALAAPTLRVYLLAGQSNMEGQACVDLDHEKYYNGGRGNLEEVLSREQQGARFAHLRQDDGAWTTRDDVFVWYRAGGERMKVGPLSIGYAVYGGRNHFGPELQFGHVVGDAHDDPVLLVKTCWGGKSLFKDFRPPSAGGEVGPYYTRMLAEYREALADVPARFPRLAKHRPQLCGFVWFQGWNDMCDATGREQYADNLAHLIRDVRRDLDAPALPVVVGETGNADHEEFRASQAAGAAHKDFRGNVTFVPTRAFLRKAEDSPNVTHGHHWFGNAESYLLIGTALGDAMLGLTKRRR
jgi:hypothetical protein